ncbi:MAG: tyrosine-protein phosphatase, partial [Acidimicrobiia bacterium]
MLGARADCSTRVACTVSWETARNPVRVYAGPSATSIDRTTPVAVVRSGNEVTIPKADPGRPLYFEVVPRKASRGPIVGDRYVGLDGTPNTRDLGGYQTFDGRRVRWGRLFRTDGLAGITPDDRTRLAALGLADACPAPDERAVPVDDAALEAAAGSVTSAETRRRDGALLRALARRPLPQWVQCTLLDDRSGWPAALVLTTLGASRETVVADHLQSVRSGAAPPPDRKYVDTAFEAIRRRYKTFGRYLGKGLGIDQRT